MGANLDYESDCIGPQLFQTAGTGSGVNNRPGRASNHVSPVRPRINKIWTGLAAIIAERDLQRREFDVDRSRKRKIPWENIMQTYYTKMCKVLHSGPLSSE